MSSAAGWREDIRSALEDFRRASELAGSPHEFREEDIEFLPAPHEPPKLPAGKTAVYGFNFNGEWLTIGHVGRKSNPRYQSQHYTGSAPSTLRGSLEHDETIMRSVIGGRDVGDWIKQETNRVNILLPGDSGERRSSLKAFLQKRLHPKYPRRQHG